MESFKITKQSAEERFWGLADITKASERYKIDKNLRYLQIAPLSILKKVFVQYRFFTHYYIQDLTLLINKLPFGRLKSILAEILYEELGNGHAHAAHPQLYDDFLRSIGIGKQELNHPHAYCIQNLLAIQVALQQKSWAYAIGLRGMGGECLCQIYLSTMYDYFSKNPVITSLRDKISWQFWEIHIGEADLHHQELIRSAINELITRQPETINDLVAGYQQSKTAWDKYWEQIFYAAKQ